MTKEYNIEPIRNRLNVIIGITLEQGTDRATVYRGRVFSTASEFIKDEKVRVAYQNEEASELHLFGTYLDENLKQKENGAILFDLIEFRSQPTMGRVVEVITKGQHVYVLGDEDYRNAVDMIRVEKPMIELKEFLTKKSTLEEPEAGKQR